MYKMIEICIMDDNGDEIWDEACVEYIEVDEDNKIVREVTNVYLPEIHFSLSHEHIVNLKQQARDNFHNTY